MAKVDLIIDPMAEAIASDPSRSKADRIQAELFLLPVMPAIADFLEKHVRDGSDEVDAGFALMSVVAQVIGVSLAKAQSNGMPSGACDSAVISAGTAFASIIVRHRRFVLESGIFNKGTRS